MRYRFTEPEFQVFLALAGVGELFAFPGVEPDGRELSKALAQLLRWGWLEERDGRPALSPGLGELADGIRKAETVLWFRAGEQRYPDRLVYVVGKHALTVTEKLQTPAGSELRVWKTDRDDLIQELLDMEILQDSSERGRKEAAELEEALAGEPKNAEGTKILTVRVCGRSGEEVRSLEILGAPLCRWLVCRNADTVTLQHVYSAEEFFEILLREMEEAG